MISCYYNLYILLSFQNYNKQAPTLKDENALFQGIKTSALFMDLMPCFADVCLEVWFMAYAHV